MPSGANRLEGPANFRRNENRAERSEETPSTSRGSGDANDIVVLKGVRKKFREQEVLKGIDMVCRRNETTCIVGGSGAGKTTLLRLVVALDKPTAGNIYVDGEDIVPLGERELNRVRKKFGMVYQYAALLDSINVLDNVAFPLVEHTKIPAKEARKRVAEKLGLLGLDQSILEKYPSELSGGMRKRVGLARALMLEPKILLYDEPTTGLDPVATKNVDDMIRDISKETGVTSVVISHDMASTFRIADRISMLNEGVIIESGSPDEILASRHEFVRAFVEMSGSVRMKHREGEAGRP